MPGRSPGAPSLLLNSRQEFYFSLQQQEKLVGMSATGLKLPVPVHIVTGGLGAGKTSFIQALLKQKPEEERWGLIINEFGAVGIDQAVLESTLPGGEVRVRELAGGCMCCSLSGVTSVAIAQLLRAIKPNRLWIEPSGLGHPAALVDVLRGEHLASALELQPIVCLVDLVQFRPARLPWGAQPDFWANELYRDQVSIADILVGSKGDLGGGQAVAAFRQWADRLYPKKQKVLTAAHGTLDLGPACLPAPTSTAPAHAAPAATAASGVAELSLSTAARQVQHAPTPQERPGAATTAAAGGPEVDQTGSTSSSSHAAPAAPAAAPAAPSHGVPPSASRPRGAQRERGTSLLWLSNAEQQEGPLPGRPQRKESRDERLRAVACGWVFHPDDTFSRPALERFLSLALQQGHIVKRVKGVFRVGPKTWVSASAGGSTSSTSNVGGSAGQQQGGAGAQAEGEEQAVQLQDVAYRRDSRLELIMPMAEGTDPAKGAGSEMTSAAATAEGPRVLGAIGDGQGRLASEEGAGQPQQEQQQEQEGEGSVAEGGVQLQVAALAAALGRATHGYYSGLDAIVLTLLQRGDGGA